MTTYFDLDSTVYVEISTSDDVFLQNISKSDIRVVFAGSLPAADTKAFKILTCNEGLQKISGVPVGNTYAIMAIENRVGRISVD